MVGLVETLGLAETVGLGVSVGMGVTDGFAVVVGLAVIVGWAVSVGTGVMDGFGEAVGLAVTVGAIVLRLRLNGMILQSSPFSCKSWSPPTIRMAELMWFGSSVPTRSFLFLFRLASPLAASATHRRRTRAGLIRIVQ